MRESTSAFAVKTERRSPVPEKSLPQAGESLRDATFDLVIGKVFVWAATAITLVGVAIVHWTLALLSLPVSPWMWTIAALGTGGVAGWRWFRLDPQLKALRQGIRGEREVGRMLERLRAMDYEVFHDLRGDGFNVDHVLVGPGGVFAIETKTWSKPATGRAAVDYDGKRVLVDGTAPDRDPLVQAEAAASFVRGILQRTTGRDVPVRPVVLFPGWFVKVTGRGGRAWVLNPGMLSAYLRNEPQKLSREDAALYADRLTRHLSE